MVQTWSSNQTLNGKEWRVYTMKLIRTTGKISLMKIITSSIFSLRALNMEVAYKWFE